MRSTFSFALIFVASIACADRLITIPTGTKIKLHTFRVEGLWEQSTARTEKTYYGFGVTDAIDAEIETEKFPGRDMRATFDVAYNYIPPITGIGPGISFGVKDVLGNSQDGRRYFLAITQREGYSDTVNGSVPMELTLGGYFGAVNSPFVGVMLPFTDKVRFMAEYDGRRISAGFDIRPLNNVGLRAIFSNRDTLVGAQVSIKF